MLGSCVHHNNTRTRVGRRPPDTLLSKGGDENPAAEGRAGKGPTLWVGGIVFATTTQGRE